MDANAEAQAQYLSDQFKIAKDAYKNACEEWDGHQQIVSKLVRVRFALQSSDENSAEIDAINAEASTHLAAMERLSDHKKDLLNRECALENELLQYLDTFRDVTMLEKYYLSVKRK